MPDFEPFKRSGRRQDVLSGQELSALFPYDEKALIEIRKRPDDMRKEQNEIALMFGTLFCVTVSAGLRSGEIRALHRNQISIANSGLVIDRAVDDRRQIAGASRFSRPCFPYHGKPVANYYILDRFRFGLDRSEQVLREFVGHRSIAMTDHYDNPILTERLIAYQKVRPSVEQFRGEKQ
ncbi:MAG: hypothetical protein LBT16_06695 [Treponema sp.]|nr:hypothetical protein [Treponema sp.]